MEFDFGKYTVVSLVGKMGSGKTEAIKSLVYAGTKAGVWKYAVVFCPTKWTGSYDWLPEHGIGPCGRKDEPSATCK